MVFGTENVVVVLGEAGGEATTGGDDTTGDWICAGAAMDPPSPPSFVPQAVQNFCPAFLATAPQSEHSISSFLLAFLFYCFCIYCLYRNCTWC